MKPYGEVGDLEAKFGWKGDVSESKEEREDG